MVAPGPAHAGRTFYGWLFGTEVMPERGVELQSWITEENYGKDDMESKVTDWLFGAFVGVNDQLEVGFPLEITWQRHEPGNPRTVFETFGVEARYRFVTQDPEDAPPFVPLVRVGVKRLIVDRETYRPELNFVASYEAGIVHVLADIGFVSYINFDNQDFELRPGIGISMLALDDLRFGAELYSELKLTSDDKSWVILGPNMSWTHGRFWLSAMYGFGLREMNNAPRVQWGIAF